MTNDTHESVARAADAAALALSPLTQGDRSGMLLAIAHAADALRDVIITTASNETALIPVELAPEFDRMVGTLRMFAGVVDAQSWVRAAADAKASPTGDAASTLIGPNHDLRSTLIPLGPVAVFGASNFPLAYGVLGGDTASALAAGCPVIVKEHPAHPRTGRLLAQLAREAIARAGGPPDALGYILNDDPADLEPARALVAHPAIAAVGFTGSRAGGLALERLARERPRPIPVFAEMGSVNPVFITPGALAARPEPVADLLAEAIFVRAGQQCTKPGVIFHGPGAGAEAFRARLRARFSAAPARDLLTPGIAAALARLNRAIAGSGAGIARIAGSPPTSPSPRAAVATLWEADLDTWLSVDALREELFGPAVVAITLPGWDATDDLSPEPSLALAIFFEPDDAEDLERTWRLARVQHRTTGRVCFNSPTTGVRVAPAMVHGGPYPATNRPDTTAVGPRAIERWCRPVCWQNCPDALSPLPRRVT